MSCSERDTGTGIPGPGTSRGPIRLCEHEVVESGETEAYVVEAEDTCIELKEMRSTESMLIAGLDSVSEPSANSLWLCGSRKCKSEHHGNNDDSLLHCIKSFALYRKCTE